ncbi:MAG: hypothetical protein A2725_04400 [Candidatus Magasanikbacteria bacterium RIFCSPHIGHO2_01_FULL_33_34]|uniref:RNA 2-O ribose methyltransferase substrate binding domain-containing protein n=1 Tax=Candidatus Magasanikbacteria bacterium RIFCSPHIGHO2_01_FULL_33_34 TaxID=1798671 RepID=A0A1F6LHS8_9BACT|nr:MAG: hypothetical protein A2725_04400 [Candidatus Magasanikbacteria bacterium RIFCSPHIGHO2_01_FULL_33_34]OGH65204.1 MAG: hypothetical protein A3B83_04160 [Candidatus Magasanikbacteria bacterium RIFCSPHIGHO2_02_FULL_33_17]OGH75251.1 MAG: hypothetical protein A3A89_04005 [Candidatus Magasanikbacteria bacterium RIFCSPLOWO2_01_FULL_33_34]OGH82173.1 MAG: hypothetical protein A3F93_00400 [Candidatus Magasanikbacteria bacterium RIFCSPLOWO2_12_FULL_34_7]
MLPAKIRTHITKLHQKKYRNLYNEFIVEGLKGIEEAINKNAEVIFLVFENDFFDKNKNFVSIVEKKGIPIHIINKNEINKIKTTTTYPGVSAVVKTTFFKLDDLIDTKQPILAFDQINDPGNLGTIIRTAEWFDVNNILLSENSVDPYNDKCVRSTMGSIFTSKLFISDNILDSLTKLKQEGYKIILLDMSGQDIDLLKPKKKSVYLFGSESHGIRSSLEKIVDMRYTIPRKGNTESLNVSIATGILLSKLK